MRISFLTVTIERFESRDLFAYVSQSAADGIQHGRNSLQGRHMRRIETARRQIRTQLLGVDQIVFDVRASPDWERKKATISNLLNGGEPND